mmetsp:Transcript_15979/g.23325  ORF Transcript_15979/g.23325 Transcript_15979/m.23325 type:complete len:398 (-) Transcript_15979:1757-2950(-)
MITSASSSPSLAIVKKYFGLGLEKVPSTDIKLASCVINLTTLQISIQKKHCTSVETDSMRWQNLKDDISSVLELLHTPSTESNNSSRVLKRYQLDLITDALLPYIRKMSEPRISLDPQRFQQIHSVRYAICDIPYIAGNDHPCYTLLAIDEVIDDLKIANKFNLWPSTFLSALESAVSKQWDPILISHKQLLQTVGTYLLSLGSFSLVWWPVASLTIMYRLITPIQRMMVEWEQKKSFNPETVWEMMQAALMLFAAGKLMDVLKTNVSMGWTCALMGVLLLVCSTQKQLLKRAVPVIAPHAVQIEEMIQHITSNSTFQKGLGMLLSPAFSAIRGVHHSNSNPTTSPYSSRVEELPEQQPSVTSAAMPVPVAVEVNDDEGDTSSSRGTSYPAGLRQRK